MSPYSNYPDPWSSDPEASDRSEATKTSAQHTDSGPSTSQENSVYPADLAPGQPAAVQIDTDANGLGPVGPITHIRAAIAWLVIVGCLLATVGLVALERHMAEDLDPEIAAPVTPSLTHQIAGRYTMGLGRMVTSWQNQLLAEVKQELVSKSGAGAGDLRYAILAGDVSGHEAFAIQARELEARANASGLSEQLQQDLELAQRVYSKASYIPTPAERDGLVARHGWYGELASSYNTAPEAPAYQRPRNRTIWVPIATLGQFVIYGLGGLLGLLLLTIAIIALATKRSAVLAFSDQEFVHRVAYLESVAVFLLLMLLTSLLAGLLMLVVDFNVMIIVLLISPFALLWPLLVGVPWSKFTKDMGYHRGRGLFREIGAGLIGYTAGLPILGVGIGITTLLTWLLKTDADHPIVEEIAISGQWEVAVLVMMAVVWAPLVEESVFRSAFYRHLRRWRGVPGWLLATLVTSFVFAAIHPQGIAGIPVLMSIAFILAGLREWRGSIIASMTAHAVHNGFAMAFLFIILYT